MLLVQVVHGSLQPMTKKFVRLMNFWLQQCSLDLVFAYMVCCILFSLHVLLDVMSFGTCL